MSEGYLIGPNLLGRIRRVVDDVEAAPMKSSTTRIETRFEGEEQRRTQTKVFRVCTFTGDWEKGTSKQVKLIGTTNTLSVTNLLYKISPDAPDTVALAGKDGTAWYFINHERGCEGTRTPANDLDSEGADNGSNTSDISMGSGVQVLLNELGCARWWNMERQEVVTDVQWVDEGLQVTKRFVWIVRDPDDETTEDIDVCGNIVITGGDITIDHGSGTIDVTNTGCEFEISATITLDTTECPE